MVFSSYSFLFVFLPLLILIYFIFPKQLGNFILLAFSLAFYFIGEGWQIWILICSVIINYAFALCIEFSRSYAKERVWFQQKLFLWVAVAANLVLLGYFKYANFLVENISELSRAVTGEFPAFLAIKQIALPLGISFFTFQALSYVIDVYSGQVRAARNPLTVATYISLFPQLVAGPIVRYSEIEKELFQRKFSTAGFLEGVYRFSIGLAAKLLLANPAGQLADQVFSMPSGQLDLVSSWWGVVWYTFQIFFDFSAYSNMAIGLGRMFGFHFPENFNYPYISRSIREFWRRWHMTLSRWFRDYVYIPLGGNRKGDARTYINLLVVFLLTGFWHGAAWNFIVWGLWHGLFLSLERSVPAGWSGLAKRYRIINLCLWGYALLVVMIGWVMFRCETLTQTLDFFKAMTGNGLQVNDLSFITWSRLLFFSACVLFATPVLQKWAFPVDENMTFFKFATSVTCLTLSLPAILSSGYSPFLYFRF